MQFGSFGKFDRVTVYCGRSGAKGPWVKAARAMMLFSLLLVVCVLYRMILLLTIAKRI